MNGDTSLSKFPLLFGLRVLCSCCCCRLLVLHILGILEFLSTPYTQYEHKRCSVFWSWITNDSLAFISFSFSAIVTKSQIFFGKYPQVSTYQSHPLPLRVLMPECQYLYCKNGITPAHEQGFVQTQPELKSFRPHRCVHIWGTRGHWSVSFSSLLCMQCSICLR